MPDPAPPVVIDPLWSPEIYEPLRDENGDPVLVSAAEYFGVSEVVHPHPLGWPCHPNCRLGDADG